VGKPRKKKWLEGLKPPDIKRRLDIIEALDPETRERLDAAGVRRTVRAFNPRPKDRRPCYVCGRHSYISQSHHLIEVGKVAGVLRALAIYDWSPSIPVVSLCPNHHAYEHGLRRIKKDTPPEVSEPLYAELSERDRDRLIEIDDQRMESQDRVWREVREEFLRREEEYHRSKSEE
jgi:hypothetical protein